MNIYYLGSSARGNNPSRSIKILHHIPGTTGGIFIANFATRDEGLLFGVEYSSIKDAIAHMNNMKESGRITQGEYEGSLRREWIPTVHTFVVS